MKHISQSQITLFRDCPHKYELKYRYKKQAIMWDPDVFHIGRLVHDTADQYYKHHFTTDTSMEAILALTYDIFKNQFDTTLTADHLKQGHRCLEAFAEFEYANVQSLHPVHPETEVKLYVGDMMGIIDYWDKNEPLAMDFKTGKRPYITYNEKIQGVMYRHLIKETYGIELDDFTFYFLYPNIKRYLKFNSATDAIHDEMIEYKDLIHSCWKTGKFPKQPRTSNMCKYCEYRLYCDKGGK